MLLHEENNLDCKIPRKEFIGRNMLGKFLENSGRFLESSPEEKLHFGGDSRGWRCWGNTDKGAWDTVRPHDPAQQGLSPSLQHPEIPGEKGRVSPSPALELYRGWLQHDYSTRVISLTCPEPCHCCHRTGKQFVKLIIAAI